MESSMTSMSFFKLIWRQLCDRVQLMCDLGLVFITEQHQTPMTTYTKQKHAQSMVRGISVAQYAFFSIKPPPFRYNILERDHVVQTP